MARAPKLIAQLAGAIHLLTGAWAMAAPQSFYDRTATFPPYNQHFVQDIGSFLIGLGVVLALASMRNGGLVVGLVGVGVASGMHTLSHFIGRDLGGEPVRDIALGAVTTVALLWGGWAAAKARA